MPSFDDSSPGPAQIISVALPRPLFGLFTYKLPAHLAPLAQIGSRVKVPFGRSVTHAFIVEPPRPLAEIPAGLSLDQLKSVLEVSDPDQIFSEDIFSLCKWAHEYYCAPFGEVLNCASFAGNSSSTAQTSRKHKPILLPDLQSQHRLTEHQQRVLEFLDPLRIQGEGKVALLQGVTGSGKTEIYIELAKRTLAGGKGVIILVPEIALSSQLHERFERGLGQRVGLWHSAVANGRRRDQYRALRAGELRALVGARSAVFAPMKDLGLIVVDEEHDPTYKQEDRVRYHARDLAVVRAKLTHSFVLLGSATPSMETLERAREGRYSKVRLDQRIAPAGLPEIHLVDLCVEERLPDIQVPLACKTVQAIQETIAQGEQVMIYLNRRGFAAFLLCKDCGAVKECPHCSISLTVYKNASHLRCHLCGHQEEIPETCLKCSSTELYGMGTGTEGLEAEIPNLIPSAKVLRLDRDQVTSTSRLDKILNDFRNGEANILLGTQMLVKGHDFPGVTLVVVILADSLFRWPDFRAPERAFQVLKQVAGRSGRGEKSGRVLIQAFDVDHPVLQALDGRISEESFLESERALRQQLRYPPFGRLARLRFESATQIDSMNRANEVAARLRTVLAYEIDVQRELELLGPSEAFLQRVKGTYRWDLLMKAKTFAVLQRAVFHARDYCVRQKWQHLADIDPYSI